MFHQPRRSRGRGLGGARAELNLVSVMSKRLTITGSTLRARPNAFKGQIAGRLKKHIWPLLAAGRCRPPVDSVFGLAEAAKAHARMEQGDHMGKIILKV